MLGYHVGLLLQVFRASRTASPPPEISTSPPILAFPYQGILSKRFLGNGVALIWVKFFTLFKFFFGGLSSLV